MEESTQFGERKKSENPSIKSMTEVIGQAAIVEKHDKSVDMEKFADNGHAK